MGVKDSRHWQVGDFLGWKTPEIDRLGTYGAYGDLWIGAYVDGPYDRDVKHGHYYRNVRHGHYNRDARQV